jgi:hypothetical protein
MKLQPAADSPAPIVARCPECAFREGPFGTEADMFAALVAHVEHRHADLIAIAKHPPLPVANDSFARAAVGGLMLQRARMDKILAGPKIVGPDGQGLEINVPHELVDFIRAADMALMAVLDLLLEIRTGHAELRASQKQPVEAPAAK